MQSRRTALVGTLFGTAFWGLSGTASQALFQIYHFPVLGLAFTRMTISGLLLLIILRPKLPDSKILGRLAAVAIFGFVGTQVSYLFAIQYSNAPTATLLQFLFLPMVAGYEALTGAFRWTSRWTAILLFAGVGTILLIGVFSSTGFTILITPIGLVAGLLAAVTAAYYSLASRKVIKERGSWWALTWGFVIGGIITSPFGIFSLASYSIPSNSLPTLLGLLVFVIIFGTILSFGLYLAGLRRLPATEIGVVASLEPIAASIAAYVFLGVRLDPVQYVGGAIILFAVTLTASSPAQTRALKDPKIPSE